MISKRITEEDIMKSLDIAVPLGFTRFKYYFMIGFPTETYEDIDAIAELGGRAAAHGRGLKKQTGARGSVNITVSVSNFVPKPGTPLQYTAGNTESELIAKVHHLKDAVRRQKGVTLKYHDTRMSRIEMLIAKGDRRTGIAIENVYAGGARFDSWQEHFNYADWLAAFDTARIPTDKDLYADVARPQPWDFIKLGKA